MFIIVEDVRRKRNDFYYIEGNLVKWCINCIDYDGFEKELIEKMGDLGRLVYIAYLKGFFEEVNGKQKEGILRILEQKDNSVTIYEIKIWR